MTGVSKKKYFIILFVIVAIMIFSFNFLRIGHKTNEKMVHELASYFHDPKDYELALAIGNGDKIGILSAISDGANINANGDYANTPLRLAILFNNRMAFDILLQKGVSPNYLTPGGVSCVVDAMRSKDDYFFNTLIEAGLNPNLVHDGIPIIIHAILIGKDNYYNALVEKGADLSAKTENGKTVASYLSSADSYDLLRDLILRGGDFMSGYGLQQITPAQQLIDMQQRFSGDPKGDPYNRRVEILRMMRDRGVIIPDGVPGL